MFAIRRVHDATSLRDQQALSAVLRIYKQAFPYYTRYAAVIAATMAPEGALRDYDVVLLVAEGVKRRVLGFTLSFVFPELGLAYLDYVASDPQRDRRGYGTALYETTREQLRELGCTGLLLDVPPDEPEKLAEPARLEVNQRRMAFYERLGARVIANTSYDTVTHRANQGYPTSLLYDDLGTGSILSADALQRVVSRILAIKGGMGPEDDKLQEVLASIEDDPVQLRPARPRPPSKRPARKGPPLAPLDLVNTGDAHQIHHLKERGYVERPARVQWILRGLEDLPLQEHPIRHFGEGHLTAVHHPSLVRFLARAEQEMKPGQLLYPNVFPIRRPDRLPQHWEAQAGYYCIDTFTPVTANAYRAARIAVDAALTGADRLLHGRQRVYVLCRPPGHHAESRAFGGFCYFNNAAVAAHHLSGHGRVALLDLDHHHGNGSQEIFYRRADVLVVSVHGHPRVCYPYFAGYADERGEGEGRGFNRNFPLYPGVDDEAYAAVLAKALAVCRRFEPDWLVVSLGLDIMAGDPTGTFLVSTGAMQRIGAALAELALPTLVVQEGGYALRNLRRGAEAFFRGLLATPGG